MRKVNNSNKSGKLKTALMIVFMLMAVFVIVGLGLQLFAKDNKYKPSEWFKKDTSQTDTLPDENNNDTENTSVANKNDVQTEELARGVLVSSSSFSGDIAALSDTSETITYDTLPIHCRHIEVGDDLSGVIIVFDYPNFSTSNHYFSPTNYEYGEYLTTDSGYTFYQDSVSKKFILRKRGNTAPYYPVTVMTFYDLTISTQLSISEWSLKCAENPITGFVLPDNTGVVTELPISKKESSGGELSYRHEYLNMYIYDPDYYNYSMYDKTRVYPYDGHNNDCAVDVVSGQSYSDGFLAINVSNVLNDSSSVMSGGTFNYLRSGQNYIVGKRPNVMALEMGIYYSYPSSASASSYMYITSYSSGWVYFRVDLLNVTVLSATPANTLKYVYAPLHKHIQPYIECPVDDCTFEDGQTISVGKTYSTGYLVFDVSDFRNAAQLAPDSGLLYWGNYNVGFYTVNGALKYKDYDINIGYFYTDIIDDTTESEYVYCELRSGNDPIAHGGSSFVRYVTHEIITVTVETEGSSRQYEIRAYTGLSVQPAFGNGWYNADGYSIDSIPVSTTFTEILDIEIGHQSQRIFNPYNYGAKVTVHVDSEGNYTPSTVDYWEGYGNDGELYLFYDISHLRSIITSYLGNELDYSKINADIKTTSKNTTEQNNYRLATYSLQRLLYQANTLNDKYNFITVTGDQTLGQFPLADSVVHIDVFVTDRTVESKQIKVPVTFYGYVDDYVTAELQADYVRYYNNVTETRMPLSAIKELCANYETFGSYCVMDDEWQTVTENGQEYLVTDRSLDIKFYIEVMRKTFKFTNSINGNSVELPIVTRTDRDGFFVQLQLDNFVAISSNDSDKFVELSAAFVNWEQIDTFPSKYLNQFITLFCANNYSALSGFGLDGNYCLYNIPSHVVLIDNSQSVHYLNGISIRIPDSCIKLGLYEYELELIDSETFGVLGAEKPNNGWDKFTGNVGDFFDGAFTDIKDIFTSGTDKNSIIKQVLFCVMIVLLLIVIIKVLSIVARVCKRSKKNRK